MTIFLAALRNEIDKITTRKKYFVLLSIEIVICLLGGLINYLIGSASALQLSTNATLLNMPMTMLGFILQVYLPLIIFMAACDLYSGEVQDGTIRAVFMRPVSRFKIYFSKVTAIFILSFVYLISAFIVTVIITAVGTHSLSGIYSSLLAYLLDAVPMIVIVLFAAMMNQFTKSTSFSVIMCIIVYIALWGIGVFVSQLSGLLFTGYMQWHTLWMGFTLPFSAMLSKLGILIGYSMIFSCVGYFLYERKEV